MWGVEVPPQIFSLSPHLMNINGPHERGIADRGSAPYHLEKVFCGMD